MNRCCVSLALAISFGLCGCSLVVDFDRSLLNDGGVDAGVDASVDAGNDGGIDEADAAVDGDADQG